jgi:hypothetical protein
MRLLIAAFIALGAAPLAAQSPDLAAAAPIAGTWKYAQVSDGSEATFATPAGAVQLSVRCMRASRQISVSKPSTAAASVVSVWTSSATRSLSAGFNPSTGRLTAQLAAYDSLLDAMVHSRGRIGFTINGQAPLVVPAWPEFARVVEDCRS